MTQEEKARYLALEANFQKIKSRYVRLIRKVREQKEEIERLRRELNAADAAFNSATDCIFAEIHRNHTRPLKAGIIRLEGFEL